MGKPAPNSNMIYDFVCHECRLTNQVERPMERAGDSAACPVCNEDMKRIFYAPKMLARHKPGSFRWDKGKLNAMDDRLAGFRHAESQGPQALKALRKNFGEQVYQATKQHRKDNYGS